MLIVICGDHDADPTDHAMPRLPIVANIREFPPSTIAQVLYQAATLREQLDFYRELLFLDAQKLVFDPSAATPESTQDCIRIAASQILPDDPAAADDLTWHASIQFKRHIRGSIQDYDLAPATTQEEAALTLRVSARSLIGRQVAEPPPGHETD